MSLFWPCFWLAMIALAMPGVSRIVEQLKRIADALEKLLALASKGRRP